MRRSRGGGPAALGAFLRDPGAGVPLLLPHRGNPLQAAALADGTVTEPGVAARSVQTSPNSSEDAVEDTATSINIQDGRVET